METDTRFRALGIGNGFSLSGVTNVAMENTSMANFTNGIWLDYSSSNTFSGNNVANNMYGIELGSSSNSVFHNSFVNNTRQVYTQGSNNIWDGSFPRYSTISCFGLNLRGGAG